MNILIPSTLNARIYETLIIAGAEQKGKGGPYGTYIRW